MKKTLYVNRPLLNVDEFVSWAKNAGFKNTLKEKDFHATIAFSKKAVNWDVFHPQNNKITISGGKRTVSPLGDEGAVVLKFESTELYKRWKEFLTGGCSWDYDSYQPHVSITYDGSSIDLKKIEPYNGKLIFGPEVFKEVDLNWKSKT